METRQTVGRLIVNSFKSSFIYESKHSIAANVLSTTLDFQVYTNCQLQY